MSTEKKKAFMIMPFQDVYMALYERLKKQFSDTFIFEHADDFDGPKGQQSILKDIVLGISNADVVIVDITGLNANVMYELGIAHALAKRVIHITQNIGEMSFDIRPYRALEYSTRFDLIDKMDKKFMELMQSIIDCSGDFNNPVTDYLPEMNVGNTQNQQMQEISNTEDVNEVISDELGFLDFINDIEDESNHITELLNDITTKMEVMSAGVNEGTQNIDKANKNGGSGNASYVRNIAQKVAGFVNAFASELRPFNTEFQESWEKIDNAYSGILNNRHMVKSDNMQQFENNAKAVKELSATMRSIKVQFESMNASVEGVKGVERRLNQACNSLSNELQVFISILDTAIASTERIYERSMMLVGS
ncbi:MAG: nucleoside 2-deoxyribosyltransferase [Oscillospiraceae bacterium]|jgi:uncharacterized protein YukE|nr:nucleoside 2-deoxyribosyltransferase [Oscillospiraceae bacterium]